MSSNKKRINFFEYLDKQNINFLFGKTDKDKGFIHLLNNNYGNDKN